MLWWLLAVAVTGAFQCVVIVGLCYVVKREHRQKVDVLQACRAVLVEHRKHEEETACKMRALQRQKQAAAIEKEATTIEMMSKSAVVSGFIVGAVIGWQKWKAEKTAEVQRERIACRTMASS